MNIPIFPLSMCLLPQGYSQLRIFEPRYKRLVTESLKSGQGFGLCMISDDKKSILPIGTLCKITDFETLADGLLGITIYGEQKFVIESIAVEHDGLKRAQVKMLASWPSMSISKILSSDMASTTGKTNNKLIVNKKQKSKTITQAEEKMLSETLKDLLNQYPQHLAHYHDDNFDDIAWVCQRWLEIIPLKPSEKYQCINSDDHKMAQSLISDIIK
ncbi:LON peptidase substrate-binding domain-containing protein [Shewanella aestuarii]|uniref:Peptidase S16 n=1 Tax=Shewanella aestuarii TaxID=1028752 RepID=A0A6G9QK24_9GAMM|nr:LON peptidase substrate-binding domain-containing protein [Shewanella aestuarii]QIR14415.1 peptidase S16 [Shewanella aestuarii]